MTAIEQAIAWMDLDKRCGGYAGHCLKCDAVLQRKFDTGESDTRNFLADTLCSCTLEDFVKHEPLLWLVALLNTARYEQFVTGIAKLAPYSSDTAWQIIRMSEHNKGNWCFILEPWRKTQFKPRFHLHPAIAPSLLAATIRADSENEDAIALLDYFEPIAEQYPVLQQAIPLWRVEKVRREEERKADWLRQQEQNRNEALKREAEWAEREVEFGKIEAGGPVVIMRAVLDAPTLSPWNCPARWAWISEKDLSTLPREMLDEITHKVSGQPASRCWNGLRNRIEHLLKSHAHSAERSAFLAKLKDHGLLERLQAACDSRWSLTYFPEDWAEQLLQEKFALPDELKTRLLSKLMRLQTRTPWRNLKHWLLRKN